MDTAARIDRLESQLKLLEPYSVAGFWQALDHVYEITLPTRQLRCIVCDHSDLRSGFSIRTAVCQFGGGQLERYECPRCDALFGPQKYLDLAEQFVVADYNFLYSRSAESDSTENERRAFRSLQPTPGSLHLNWGCGEWSQSIPQLRAEGFDVWGYEPSAPESAGHIVKWRGEISAQFDGIFSNNVIEHFRDPVAQFQDFKSLLKPNASMAHASPCYAYNYAFTRFHTLFLLGRSPHLLAERTGFRVESATVDGEFINHVFRSL
jgi:hypothetical protein